MALVWRKADSVRDVVAVGGMVENDGTNVGCTSYV